MAVAKNSSVPENSLSSNLGPYGFERPDDFDYKNYNNFMEHYLEILSTRGIKWELFMRVNKSNPSRGIKIKRYVRKGVPDEYRGKIWMLTSGAQVLKDENPNLYKTLLASTLDPEIVNIIKTDIPRTFPDNIYFSKAPNEKLNNLFNVLVAFAHRNPQIGYCQGLNFIAGILLLLTNSEETTFWLLVILTEKILPDYYTSEMIGLLTDLEVLSELVKIKVPLVHQHFERLGLAWPLVTTKWFICLYAEVLPVETVLRIWDSLFYEGSKVLFRVAIALLMMNQSDILQAGSFVDATVVIKSIIKNSRAINCHEFMQNIFKLPGSFPKSQIINLRIQLREQFIKTKTTNESRPS
ncbi:Growth hormone-regulated TBC protein 1-A [Nymphon striatum]|nr:Growth hormone-regulated TBC protein 1-A [Nymphon striatum]KAG1692267.1 Growth hormone-regulated TBC protein 1-A [Nymphon striatum]